MSALPQDKLYTIEDILSLPEGERAELIDGRIYDMAAPSVVHQRLVFQISRALGNYVADQKGLCEVFVSPFAVYPDGLEDDYNYLEPDISVVCDPAKTANGKGCDGAPDLVIEIVSPSTASNDYVYKLRKYSLSGVREYWIVNPESEIVNVFDFQGSHSNAYHFRDNVPVGIWPGFYLCLAALLR